MTRQEERFGERTDVPSVAERLARTGGFVGIAVVAFVLGQWAPLRGTVVGRTLEAWLGHGWWTSLLIVGAPPLAFAALVAFVFARRVRGRQEASADPIGTRRFRVTDRPLGLPGAVEYRVRLMPDLLCAQPVSILLVWRDWYRIPADAVESIERRGSGVVVRGTDLNHGDVELGLYLESKARTDALQAALEEWARTSTCESVDDG